MVLVLGTIACHSCASHCTCPSDDGTHSSEFTGVSNCEIFPAQVDSTWEEGVLVAGRLPVPLGPREEVGDTRLSIYVSKSVGSIHNASTVVYSEFVL